MKKKYATMYERLVANTRLAIPDAPQSCWLWTGTLGTAGHPQIAVRVNPRPAAPRSLRAHRVMLEEVLDATFPHDEGGHLCFEQTCVHPDHLEPQTPVANRAARRGYVSREDGCMIPTLFPRVDALQEAANRAWDEGGTPATMCPF